jgi:hypothetical protein
MTDELLIQCKEAVEYAIRKWAVKSPPEGHEFYGNQWEGGGGGGTREGFVGRSRESLSSLRKPDRDFKDENSGYTQFSEYKQELESKGYQIANIRFDNMKTAREHVVNYMDANSPRGLDALFVGYQNGRGSANHRIAVFVNKHEKRGG